MLAYHLGVEVECKIAEAIHPRHYQAGFHSTATCGTFAAAAASAKLLGLDVEATQRALSIAGSQSAGLRENFGTMTKPFHAGRAAESGVAAAQFASYGWTATDRILEAPRGFFSAAGGGWDPAAIAGRLGEPWTFAEPGISIKPHPSGSLTHPGMTEMLRLIPETTINLIERCSGHGGTFGVMKATHPVANKVGRPAVRQIAAKGAETLCSDCPLACKHLGQLLEAETSPDAKAPPRQEHPIEVFARAYGAL